MNANSIYLTCWPEDPAWPDRSNTDPYDVIA